VHFLWDKGALPSGVRDFHQPSFSSNSLTQYSERVPGGVFAFARRPVLIGAMGSITCTVVQCACRQISTISCYGESATRGFKYTLSITSCITLRTRLWMSYIGLRTK
jgi:hypothetical protein